MEVKDETGQQIRFRLGLLLPTVRLSLLGAEGGRAWRMGFPKREDYLRRLEQYKEELEAMQRDIAEELKKVEQEIERQKRA